MTTWEATRCRLIPWTTCSVIVASSRSGPYTDEACITLPPVALNRVVSLSLMWRTVLADPGGIFDCA